MATTRNTYCATLIYPESAPPDWQEKLEEQHIQALISPPHDRDKDKEKENEANLIELTQIILDKQITYFHEVADLVIKEHNELFGVLKTNSYYIHSIVMSLATQTQKEKERNLIK